MLPKSLEKIEDYTFCKSVGIDTVIDKIIYKGTRAEFNNINLNKSLWLDIDNDPTIEFSDGTSCLNSEL